MKIRLLRTYMTHPAGTILDYPYGVADLLIHRKTAEKVEEEQPPPEPEKAAAPRANKSQSHRKPHRNK